MNLALPNLPSLPRTELDLFHTPFVCPLGSLGGVLDHISTLNVLELKKLLQEEFYNSSLMGAVSCIVNAISLSVPGKVEYNKRIRNKISKLNLIPNDTVNGFAFLAKLEGSLPDIFVIKTAQRNGLKELIHEAVVTSYGTNLLRDEVPNFAYTFGTFKCSAPTFDQRKQVVTWCAPDKQDIYLVQENISPSISMDDYVTTSSFENMLNLYLQTLYALRVANHAINFTHYDLHSDNVLVRDLGREVYIPYPTERNTTEYILTSKLATIIDFGTSHAVCQGVNCSKNAYVLSSNTRFPLHDAYKLLMFMIYSRADFDKTESYKLMRFFHPTNKGGSNDNLDKILSDRSKYYSLPYTAQYTSVDLFELITYIRANFATPFIVQEQELNTNIPIFQCSSGRSGGTVCRTLPELNLDLNLNVGDVPQVTNAIDFYDLISRYEAEGRKGEIDQIKATFRYPDAIQNNLARLKVNLSLIEKYGQNKNPLVSINDIETTNIPLFQTYVFDTLKCRDLIIQTRLLLDSLFYVMSKYSQAIPEELYMNEDALNRAEIANSNDIKELQKLKSDIREYPLSRKELLLNHPKASWFFDSFVSFVSFVI